MKRGTEMVISFWKKTLAAVSAAAVITIPTASGYQRPASVTQAAPDEYHDDWLHVNENAEIVDMDGNPVWMTGCNWFGYNVGSQVFDGVWSRNMHECLNEIADHGFNLLRVPMSTQIILQWKNNEPDDMIKVNEWSNPELTLEGIEGGTVKYSFDIWNQAVKWCRENGIKIMIDIHCATTNSAGHNVPLWYDDNYSTEDWLEALSWITEYYKDDDTIIAIDLKNEPHGEPNGDPNSTNFAKWDGSTDDNNWRYAAERGAAAVLEKNPNMLIVVEGIQVYPKFDEGKDWTYPYIDYANYGNSPYYGAWWGANFRGAIDYPVDLGEYQSQLVYSPHDYGPEVWEQDWFYLDDDTKTFTRETLLDDYWYDTWAYLVEENISPLLMGEWGGWTDDEHDTTGENRHWLQELRDYMIDMHIHHTFWCFNENSSDTGGLVYNNFLEWDNVKYEFVRPALWQNDNGNFISLDHTIPVGSNGITLTEYYNGVSKPLVTTTYSPLVAKALNITTETTASTTTTTTTPATTTSGSPEDDIAYGDANCNDTVEVADAVLILQSIANPDKYGVDGSDEKHITSTGMENADCNLSRNGVTSQDALYVQQAVLKMITLPVE